MDVIPHIFKGGKLSDYAVELSQKGTLQTRHLLSNKEIPTVAQGANKMLIEANLAVGLLNTGLGVANLALGAYNAYKITKVHGEIKQNHQIVMSHLSSIENTLQVQQRSLEILAFHQWQLSEQMQLLRQEMQAGFNTVLKTIEDTNIKQKRATFSERTFILERTYRRFVDLLLNGNEIAAEKEARELINCATSLEAWLNVELKQIDPGQAERLPLRVAEAYAVRAKADAYTVMGEGYQSIAERELTDFETAIQEEVYHLCNNKTLYYVGAEVPEVIAQYVYLYRGIHRGKQLLGQPSTEILIQAEDLEWDDSLNPLREILRNKPEQSDDSSSITTIPLKTMADMEWYIRFTEQDREQFDILAFANKHSNGLNSRYLLLPFGLEQPSNLNNNSLSLIKKIVSL